jgi:cell division protein FtsW
LKIDVTLLLSVITLLIFGILIVYSASYDYSLSWYGDPNTIFYRQLFFLVGGICLAIFLTFWDYHNYRHMVVIMMLVVIAALISVLLVNEILNNAARTLYGGSIQPSEFAKIVTVLYLSVWLFARQDQLRDVNFGLLPLAIILGVIGGLIFLQPDLSAVVTILFLGGVMFFLAGGDLRQIVILMLVAVFVGWVLVQFSPTGSERIGFYLAGLRDPTEGSYHVKRSFEAFVNGGWFGVGIGRAETKLTGLPVPPTDSIFAVVGEETGVVGSIGLVALYAIFLWRGMVISRRAPDELGRLLAAGLCLWIAVEAFVNMAVMVNILPFAGNALPFISSGGSNLTVTMAAVGILLNISRLSVRKQEENGKFFNAPVNLRGWDRRRRLSSPVRPARTQRK